MSRRAPRGTGLVAALAACGAVVAGCGGGGGSTAATSTAPPPTAEQAAVRTTILTYISAFLAGQGDRACALLTEHARQAFIASIAGSGVHDCATGFRRAARELTAQERHLFDGARVEDVSISGDRATAVFKVPLATVPIRLARERGAWRIANLPPR